MSYLETDYEYKFSREGTAETIYQLKILRAEEEKRVSEYNTKHKALLEQLKAIMRNQIDDKEKVYFDAHVLSKEQNRRKCKTCPNTIPIVRSHGKTDMRTCYACNKKKTNT
jgi:hypothetical protein